MPMPPRDRKDTMHEMKPSDESENQEVHHGDETCVSVYIVCQEVVAQILESVFNCDIEELAQELIDDILEDISFDNKELCHEIVGDILKSAFIPDDQEMCQEVVDDIVNSAVCVDSQEHYLPVVAHTTPCSENVMIEYESEQVCEKILSDVIMSIVNRL